MKENKGVLLQGRGTRGFRAKLLYFAIKGLGGPPVAPEPEGRITKPMFDRSRFTGCGPGETGDGRLDRRAGVWVLALQIGQGVGETSCVLLSCQAIRAHLQGRFPPIGETAKILVWRSTIEVRTLPQEGLDQTYKCVRQPRKQDSRFWVLIKENRWKGALERKSGV